MKIGVVKEIKKGEARVGMTPENVRKLVMDGHQVLVQKDAGLGSGYSNEEYISAGANLVSQREAWEVDMVVKVKEPLPAEYHYFKKDLIVWGFLHLAASKECVEAMQRAGTTAIAGETISEDGVLSLLKPMSAIAGRRAVFMGAYYLEKQHQGEGILLSGIEGIPGGNVVILGGGNAAINACDMAIGIGCNVTILEVNTKQIEYLKQKYINYPVEIVESNTQNLENKIKDADLFISTILIPGSKPPKIVKEYMVQSMKPGSVIVDIAIDQGGTIETVDHYTTHDAPIFIKHDIIHYAVPNMPGATPRTSTMALANGNIEYLMVIAKEGLENALNHRPSLASGINIYKGIITYENLGTTLELDYKSLKEVLI
ncbi:alanine dehydrogenase [Bacillus cereus]|uniref:alanine dehydrogenase n=1 Tax=Bacillus cereus group TaxID=86661 RepID=UPI0004516467|nr:MULTISPECIES: alanine dehydrogenase [Bacillus cereus group]EXY05364.1 alanine dehydrogenase [Bacillus thuringiensis]MEB8633694.1 alanine dehydrogenase [Bacillus cereus]MEB8745683.1 alanine dehydrogenase [Bacillus cereus]MEB8799222.1 alanine dehydrogenase [Bacillus cereus]MEB8810213.1 alanine dehydrogenase [Bacillus cereus]